MDQRNTILGESLANASANAAESVANKDRQPASFSRKQASEYLKTRWGLSYAVYTLAAYAAKGIGPEYQKAGPLAVYTREALDEWAKTKLTAPGRKASELKPMAECGHEKA
jgi:hypothetical protein